MTITRDDVDYWLAELPAHTRWLPAALVTRTKQDGPTSGTAATSSTPLNLAIAQLLDTTIRHTIEMEYCDPESVGVGPYLWGWVRDTAADLIDQQGPHAEPEPDTSTVDASCAYLRRHLDFITTQPQWLEFSEGIRHVHHAVALATNHVREDAGHDVACGTCHRGWLRPITHNEWQCTACDKHLIIRPVTLTDAARATGGSLRTLQHWAKQGRFTRVEDTQGRTVYDLGEIQSAVTKLTLERLLNGYDTPGRKHPNTHNQHT